MTGKQFVGEAVRQAMKTSEPTGAQVAVYLFLHAGRLLVFVPIVAGLVSLLWTIDTKDRVERVARELDIPICVKLDTIVARVKRNERTNRETYYSVKKVELIQSRTSPHQVVKEASEEIEIEREIDLR